MKILLRICTAERVILLIILVMCLYNVYLLSEFDYKFGDALYLYTLYEESLSGGKPILWMDAGSMAQSTLIHDEHDNLSISSHLIYRHYLSSGLFSGDFFEWKFRSDSTVNGNCWHCISSSFHSYGNLWFQCILFSVLHFIRCVSFIGCRLCVGSVLPLLSAEN